MGSSVLSSEDPRKASLSEYKACTVPPALWTFTQARDILGSACISVCRWKDMWLAVFVRNRLPAFLWPVRVAKRPWDTTAQENSRLNRGKPVWEQAHAEAGSTAFVQSHTIPGKLCTEAKKRGLTMGEKIQAALCSPHSGCCAVWDIFRLIPKTSAETRGG